MSSSKSDRLTYSEIVEIVSSHHTDSAQVSDMFSAIVTKILNSEAEPPSKVEKNNPNNRINSDS